MGTSFVCEKIETDEEMIGSVMTGLSLNKIDASSAYDDFLKCINGSKKLELFLFQNFLLKLYGDNNYSKIQNSYFKNLSKHEGKNIKKIGIMIIMLSKCSNNKKINLIIIHFLNLYLTHNLDTTDTGNNEIIFMDFKTIKSSLKEIINDIIECNTEDCLNVCQQYMGADGIDNISKIWKNRRKRKLLFNILRNLEKIKYKFKKNKFDDEDEDNYYNEENRDDSYDSKDDYEDNVHTQKNTLGNNTNEILYDRNIINEFIELSFPQLNGEYIRNFLYDEYMKERTFDKVCY